MNDDASAELLSTLYMTKALLILANPLASALKVNLISRPSSFARGQGHVSSSWSLACCLAPSLVVNILPHPRSAAQGHGTFFCVIDVSIEGVQETGYADYGTAE